MKNNLSNIKKAIKYLNNNECIGIPTETVYGLAANAYSDKATRKIFNLKKRPKKNPLIVHYYSLNDLKKDCVLDLNFFRLYKEFCPGPISFVLKLKNDSHISENVTNKKKTIAIRFPSHKLTRSLLKFLEFPLAAPSANLSKQISPVSKSDGIDEFGKKVKFTLNLFKHPDFDPNIYFGEKDFYNEWDLTHLSKLFKKVKLECKNTFKEG